jgi:hypothetical protein
MTAGFHEEVVVVRGFFVDRECCEKILMTAARVFM